MDASRLWTPVVLLVLWAPWTTGCHQKQQVVLRDPDKIVHYQNVATRVEYPEVCALPNPSVDSAAAPFTLAAPLPTEFWDLTLEEAIQTALANSEVIRDLGGRVLTGPQQAATVYEPAITESDPVRGVEAALSAFDARFNAGLTGARTDRPINVRIDDPQFGAFFVPNAVSETGTFQAELAKQTAAGTELFVRNITTYEQSNSIQRRFPSDWVQQIEAEFRQPLLQGAGIEFNRIAGPQATPGFFFSNGVLLARVNTDISIADFEAGVRNFVSDVENAYWDLYFAYRNLDAQIAGRDAALAVWRNIRAKAEFGAAGGEADQEAQALQQYYLFKANVENALSGQRGGSTQTGGVSGGGQFAGAGGVYAREDNLRFLMGLPPASQKLIRPADEPLFARVEFYWPDLLQESLIERVELRRQRWVIKQSELTMVATRNFLLPRLDITGLYRFYGLGDDLLDPNPGNDPLDNAFGTLTSGDYQEWNLGLQFSVTLGQRQAWSALRNAELNLARERAVLRTQELQVLHSLAAAVRELERAYQLAQTNFNRRIAAAREVEAVAASYEVGKITLDVLLEAQQRLAEAESLFYRSLVEYSLAIKGVHFEKGTLLEYCGIRLAEGPWHPEAYYDAKLLAQRFAKPVIDYRFLEPHYFAGKPLAAAPAEAVPPPTPAGDRDEADPTFPGIEEPESDAPDLPPMPESLPDEGSGDLGLQARPTSRRVAEPLPPVAGESSRRRLPPAPAVAPDPQLPEVLGPAGASTPVQPADAVPPEQLEAQFQPRVFTGATAGPAMPGAMMSPVRQVGGGELATLRRSAEQTAQHWGEVPTAEPERAAPPLIAPTRPVAPAEPQFMPQQPTQVSDALGGRSLGIPARPLPPEHFPHLQPLHADHKAETLEELLRTPVPPPEPAEMAADVPALQVRLR